MPTQHFRLRGLQICVFATLSTNVMSVVWQQQKWQFARECLCVTLFNLFVFAPRGEWEILMKMKR